MQTAWAKVVLCCIFSLFLSSNHLVALFAFLFPIGFVQLLALAWPSFNIFDAKVGTPESCELRFRLIPVSGNFFVGEVVEVAGPVGVAPRKLQRGCETGAGVLRERKTLTLGTFDTFSGVWGALTGSAFFSIGWVTGWEVVSARRLDFVTANESTDDFLAESSLDERRWRPPGVARLVTLLAWEGWFSESLL